MSDWYCVINGQQHGPKPLSELQDWARQGVLKPTDLVWTEGMAGWVSAGTVQGQFPFATTPPPTMISPMPPSSIPSPVFQRPHRGTTVLVLGIVGIVCCVIPGIIAWVMGNSDLRDMNQGRMDPSGRGLTQAGKVCGIVSVVLAIIGVIIALISMVTARGAHFHPHGFRPGF